MENNLSNSALLILDMQAGILDRNPDAGKIVVNVKKAIDKARSKKLPVIYVTLGFRRSVPEFNPNNKMFSGMKQMLLDAEPEAFARIHSELSPLKNDFVVVKRRVSAFSGSDLELILKSLHIEHIILTGISTSGVVLSTVREAADKDYRITVLSDCCADRDEEVHQVLVSKVFPRQADVCTVEEMKIL